MTIVTTIFLLVTAPVAFVAGVFLYEDRKAVIYENEELRRDCHQMATALRRLDAEHRRALAMLRGRREYDLTPSRN